jgi:hypothetical protein
MTSSSPTTPIRREARVILRIDLTPVVRAMGAVARAFRRMADALAAWDRRLRARRAGRQSLLEQLRRGARHHARQRARARARSQRNTAAGPRRRKHGRATR